MGVFEMIVLIVLISTVGKVLSRRGPKLPPQGDARRLAPGEVEDIRQTLDELSNRLVRLEEERDFYKELLDAPERRRALSDPEGPAAGQSPSVGTSPRKPGES